MSETKKFGDYRDNLDFKALVGLSILVSNIRSQADLAVKDLIEGSHGRVSELSDGEVHGARYSEYHYFSDLGVKMKINQED